MLLVGINPPVKIAHSDVAPEACRGGQVNPAGWPAGRSWRCRGMRLHCASRSKGTGGGMLPPAG